MGDGTANPAGSQGVPEWLRMPDRRLPLEFYIDTNRINARQCLPEMNQLEKWHKDGVISLQMPEEAYEEAARRNAARAAKARSYIYSTVTPSMRAQHRDLLDKIEAILFPQGARTQSELNDISIVFNAGYYMSALVTNDGDSKTQPNGILGNRQRLAELGIQVMRDSEAVSYVREKIKERDRRARWIVSVTGGPLPEWVGSD